LLWAFRERGQWSFTGSSLEFLAPTSGEIRRQRLIEAAKKRIAKSASAKRREIKDATVA